MGQFTQEEANLNIEVITEGGERIQNVKELRIGNGKVRIKDGAIIINDGTNDRVIIGYLKGKF